MTFTDTSRQRARIEAQIAHEDALGKLATLIHEAKVIGRRATKIGEITHALQLSPEQPLHSETALLMLAPGDFQDIQFASLREVANAIVTARREVTETGVLARAMGCNV